MLAQCVLKNGLEYEGEGRGGVGLRKGGFEMLKQFKHNLGIGQLAGEFEV